MNFIPSHSKDFSRIIKRAEFTEESYELYKRYNKAIHVNMKMSKESYKNFLCVSGLKGQSATSSNYKVLEYGCFHFKYYLDSTLIAVSVVDILPEGLSSVYYFYEPNLKKYSLGVVGNLKDIAYIREMNAHFPQFRYYYLGFYIHNNSKMSYKASYRPIELLCPSTFRWVVYDKSAPIIITEGAVSPQLYREFDTTVIDDMNFDSVDVEKYVQ